MVKLVDMPDLGSGAARRVGSSPIIRTESRIKTDSAFFVEIGEKFIPIAQRIGKSYLPAQKVRYESFGLFLFTKSSFHC